MRLTAGERQELKQLSPELKSKLLAGLRKSRYAGKMDFTQFPYLTSIIRVDNVIDELYASAPDDDFLDPKAVKHSYGRVMSKMMYESQKTFQKILPAIMKILAKENPREDANYNYLFKKKDRKTKNDLKLQEKERDRSMINSD